MSWDTWLFAFSVTFSSMAILLLGIILRRLGLLDEQCCYGCNRLVFNLALPCLLFFSMVNNQNILEFNLSLVVYSAVGTVLSFLLLELLAPKLVKIPEERGLFVQGSVRANAAIIGLAYCANAYGSAGVAIASLYMVMPVILFNILSTISLVRSLPYSRGEQSFLRYIVSSVIKNPLVLGIIAGVIYAALKLPMPKVIAQTGNLIAGLALPLALLCTGATLNLKAMFYSSSVASMAAVFKLLVIPLLLTFGGWLLGFQELTLGVIFLITSAPTAAASYVMAQAMGGNTTLAANIVALTTFGSFFTTSISLSLLRSWGLA